ncbi:MAG: hypothetical protein K2M11_07165 [Paramuribaculum sp.]|nr:hypothetical protein [Paramuribaculum sp.]
MKKELTSLLLLAIVLFGCKEQNISDLPSIVKSAETLADADTVYTTDEYFIQNIDIKNGRIALKNVNDKIDIIFLDKDCKGIEDTIMHGAGPLDLLEGSFMKTCVNDNDSNFVIYDASIGKILTAKYNPGFSTSYKENKDIIHVGELCIGDSLLVGHPVSSTGLFVITDVDGETIPVEYYLTMSNELKNELGPSFDMIMRHNLALNSRKDRILAFSYYFDAVAVYSTDGKLIRTNRESNDVTEECELIKNAGEYWLHSNPCATEDACYVKVTKVIDEKKTDSYLVKYSWNGDLLNAYKFPEDCSGAYAISADSKLYCIVADIKGEEERYHVVSYPLN